MFEFITVRELYELYINDRNQLDGIEYVELQGWIRTNRNSGKVGFLAFMVPVIIKVPQPFISRS